jgi:ATP-dependent DNA ligase
MNAFFNVEVKRSHPKLYSRDSNGNIRVWWIDQENEKYRACSGVDGGKIVENEWTIAEGKNIGQSNETSPTDQATKEITARYKDQKKSGYFDDPVNVDTKTTKFKPMLAEKWLECKDDVKWDKGNYVSPKLDGLRCVFTKDGCFSREGNPFFAFPHIGRELKPLFDKNPNLILDGEIYTHRLRSDFNKLISLAKKQKPTQAELAKSEEYLQYWIFDCPSMSGGFHDRYQAFKKLILDNYRDNKWIRVCIHTHIKSADEIEGHLQEWLTHGFEGLMLNTFDGQYANRRSVNLLKYKLFIDEEFEVVDVVEGIGNRSGMMGAIVLKGKVKNNTFRANARGDIAYYTQMLKDKHKVIGKQATVRYQNLTPDEQVPRFGVVVAIRDYE